MAGVEGPVERWEAGGARQVTRGGGFTAIESTDGRYVYFARRLSGTPDPQNSIWRIPVEGGDEEVVVESFRSTPGSWDLTADGVYFVDQTFSGAGMRWVVRFLGFGQRQATEVASLRHPPYPRRACRQRLVRRPLPALHAEPGRIRSDAGRDVPLMRATRFFWLPPHAAGVCS